MSNFFPMRGSMKSVIGLKDLINYINDYKPVNELVMIEIGSYIGESTVIFAERFKHVISVDPFIDNYDPDDHACKRASFDIVYKEFLSNTRKYSNISHIRKTSDEALNDFLLDSIDFVYIDGNHTYDFVKKDIENYFKIVKPTGFLGGHDFPSKDVQRAIGNTINYVDHNFSDDSWIKMKVA